jgi:hypothetical protein
VEKGDLAKGDVVALVHPCGNSQHDEDSLLTEIWYLEYMATNIELPPLDNAGNVLGEGRGTRTAALKPKLYLVNIASIVERIFVVEEMPLVKRYIQPNLNERESRRVVCVRDMNLWPYFLDF